MLHKKEREPQQEWNHEWGEVLGLSDFFCIIQSWTRQWRGQMFSFLTLSLCSIATPTLADFVPLRLELSKNTSLTLMPLSCKCLKTFSSVVDSLRHDTKTIQWFLTKGATPSRIPPCFLPTTEDIFLFFLAWVSQDDGAVSLAVEEESEVKEATSLAALALAAASVASAFLFSATSSLLMAIALAASAALLASLAAAAAFLAEAAAVFTEEFVFEWWRLRSWVSKRLCHSDCCC